MKNQEKAISVLQSIIYFVPKGFHEMQGLLFPGYSFNVKSKNVSKNFLLHPFLLVSMSFTKLRQNFGIFQIGKSSLSDIR